MRIAREEIFGPVVSIIPFDTEEEALRLANATPYGLSGSIWSRDIGKALRAAKALQAGVISVNSNSSVHTEAPFGGYKMSGIGRELGMSRARPLHRDEERLHRPELIDGALEIRAAPVEPVAERPGRRPERDPGPRDASGGEGHDLGRLGRRRRRAADDPRLEGDRHDRRLEPRVEPDDLARLDEQPGLLPGLADRPPG